MSQFHFYHQVKDADGNIALHESVRPNEPDALTTMLNIYEAMARDADINEQNNEQKTVLLIAVEQGFSEQIPRLVMLGANLDAKVIIPNFHLIQFDLFCL